MKWLAGFLVLCLAVCAHAKPEFWDVFKKHYKPAAGSELSKAECATCHLSSMPKRNPFGRDVQAQIGKGALTVAMLRKIEGKDSDSDGASNIDEIKAGKLPGETAAVEESPGEAPFVPTHSLHPLIVHFPIGIFLFGVIADFWGRFRSQPELRVAAKYALIVGAFSSLLGVATGLLAMFRMELAIEGTMLIHLILGSGSALMSIVVAMWRLKGEQSTTGYWALLALSGIVMALTGHFGAEMVWS